MWQCEGNHVTLHADRCQAAGNLEKPHAGLSGIQFAGQNLPIKHLFAAHWQPSGTPAEVVEEHYLRGRDLIVTYAETSARKLRPQVYWRILNDEAGPGAFGLEWIVSMQTSLLDSQPQVDCITTLDGDTWQIQMPAAEDDFVLCRHTGGAALLLLAHPSDRPKLTIVPAESSASPSGTADPCVVFHLFAEHLEKGVIRRGRLRALLLAEEPSRPICEAAAAMFRESPPPLTT